MKYMSTLGKPKAAATPVAQPVPVGADQPDERANPPIDAVEANKRDIWIYLIEHFLF
jgi:hypothetical protein